MLLKLNHVLTQQELQTAQHHLHDSKWENGNKIAGWQAAQAKNNQQLPEHSVHLSALRELVLSALQQNPLFFTAALPLHIAHCTTFVQSIPR